MLAAHKYLTEDFVALCGEQKAFNVYATATLSGDVANAIALLKRMARPTSRKHKVTWGSLRACVTANACRTCASAFREALCRALH